jgi:hypothetical protein
MGGFRRPDLRRHLPDEISAWDLLDLAQDFPDGEAEQHYGKGAARIHWSVQGDGTFEAAPFQHQPLMAPPEDFLTYYSWPEHHRTGERLCWNRLPVVDKLWRPRRADKGGFFQEATGWKPSPLQPVVYVPQILAAAGRG